MDLVKKSSFSSKKKGVKNLSVKYCDYARPKVSALIMKPNYSSKKTFF